MGGGTGGSLNAPPCRGFRRSGCGRLSRLKKPGCFRTLTRVTSQAPHLPDFSLVELCLEHDAGALAQLQESYRGPVTAYLQKAGANGDEARETVEMLWGDLLTPSATGRIRLGRYDGSCALLTWLNTVAMNALLTRKRIDGRRDRRFISRDAEDRPESSADEISQTEVPLVRLMSEALEFAFQNCPAEDFVLLQLEHCDQLKREELARMFGCSKATVSRMLASARVGVAEATMNFLRERDPWLELQWEDFLELCRTASPACFGIEE